MPIVRVLTLPITVSWKWLQSFPKIYSIPALLCFLVAGTYFLWFGLTTPIAYAYSGENCVNDWTIAPDLQHQATSSPFTITYKQPVSFLGVDFLSRQSCFNLEKITKPGNYQTQISPFGNIIAASRYQLNLPEPPNVSLTALSKPIPLTKPVILNLSSQDETFTYALQANDKETKCKTSKLKLKCELEELSLEQGQSYQFVVARYFAEKPIETVVKKQTEILKATTVTDTSIKPDEVVLAKPTEVVIYFDKPISSAEAEIYHIGDKQEKVDSTVELGESELKLTFSDLPRQSEFEVKVDSLVAKDESSLIEPYVLRFKTSGGPRVSGVSIPQSGVALGASAVISFDQELSLEQDVASLVTIEGGSAKIYRSGNAVVVGLNGVGKCTDFTIKVTNQVQSIYGIDGSSSWRYSSRTICHTVEVFGYSVKGRPLLAFIFGSGSKTILFTGAIHGNERSSSYLMENWIKELEANARSLPSGKQIVIIPEVNPDGMALGTRNNANNVDLNRNFDVSDWKSDITDTYGNPIPKGGGSEPMSEPETKALAAYTSRLKPRLTMSFHSIGGLVIANQAGDSNALARTYSLLTGYGNATGQSSQTFDYAISGTYDDWIAEKLGLPSVLVELGSHTYSQFPINQRALWEMTRN